MTQCKLECTVYTLVSFTALERTIIYVILPERCYMESTLLSNLLVLVNASCCMSYVYERLIIVNKKCCLSSYMEHFQCEVVVHGDMYVINTNCKITLQSHLPPIVDKPLNLDSLLIHLRPHVTPKWHQFGVAIGTPTKLLDELSSYSDEECMVEVTDYWLRHHEGQVTWEEVTMILREIGFHQLADELLNGTIDDTGE